MMDIILTNEQEEFLLECEEEFKERYTEKDSSFMKIKMQTPKKPPIMDPWYNKPRRSHYSWSRQNQNRSRHWDRRNNDRNERWERHAGKHHMYHRQKMY